MKKMTTHCDVSVHVLFSPDENLEQGWVIAIYASGYGAAKVNGIFSVERVNEIFAVEKVSESDGGKGNDFCSCSDEHGDREKRTAPSLLASILLLQFLEHLSRHCHLRHSQPWRPCPPL